jgi:hypothetical protein
VARRNALLLRLDDSLVERLDVASLMSLIGKGAREVATAGRLPAGTNRDRRGHELRAVAGR